MSTLMKIHREVSSKSRGIGGGGGGGISTTSLTSSFSSSAIGGLTSVSAAEVQSLKNESLLLETAKFKMNDSFSASSLNKLSINLASNTNDTNENTKLKIRFLLFVEDAEGVRYNIFDSAKSSLKSSNAKPNINTNSSSNSNLVHNSTQLNSPTSPISPNLSNEMLTRMVFGSFPMVVSNRTAIKVHSLKNSNKTMISNVFVYYNAKNSKQNRIRNRSNCSCHNALGQVSAQIRRESLNQIRTHLENNTLISNNTKPIDIVKLNNEMKLQKTYDNHRIKEAADYDKQTNCKEIAAKVETPQLQSLSSSDVGSSANLSINQETIQQLQPNQQQQQSLQISVCSSVPTYYGSYSGIYKRLMRSVSNSLISTETTTNTAIPSNELASSFLKNSSQNDSISELDSLNELEKLKLKRKASVSMMSNSSFSNNNYSKENVDETCEKCNESQRYPKFKIGIAVIFCLGSASPTYKSPASAPSSPQSVSNSPSNNNNQQVLNKPPKASKQPFDPLILFPSLPSLPSSPTNNNENKFNFNSNSQSAQLASAGNVINRNENFYEFFFSHLPIIEYQIKELKEKIIQNLPMYFNPINCKSSSTRSQFVSASQSVINIDTNYLIKQNRIQFNQKMTLDFEEYERNFFSLYLSPRLSHPAWLTLINNRNLVSTQPNNCKQEQFFKPNPTNRTNLSNHLKTINSKTTQVCNCLINDFIYLNKIINPKIANNSTNTSHGKRFLSNFRNAFSLNSSQSTLNDTKLNMASTLNSSFLSILLSTVLKHHLSWVYTVLPSNELDSSTQNVNLLRKQRANWTAILEKTNPYNPLWAQLGDLHGAVNNPLKLVRTVIVGKNKELIERLLFLLSYFIRCSNSSYFDISAENFDFEKLPSHPSSGQASASSSASSTSSPNSTYYKQDYKSPIKSIKHNCNNINENIGESEEFNESDSFLIENKKTSPNYLHLETTSTTISREVNVFELSIDPMSQLNAVLANAVIFNNNTNLKKLKKSVKKRNDEFCMSLSPSSSIASPSSCSMASSPLNLHSIKTNKSNTLSSNNNSNKFQLNEASNRKQRNLSSNSYGENCNAQELPLIGCKLKPNYLKSTRMQDNFGYSLLASYSEEFVFEFVLHGTSNKSFLNNLNERLVFSKQNSIIDCEIQECVYIVVDVDDFEIKVYSSESQSPPVAEKSIPLIDSLVQSVLDMIKLFQNSEFVLLHLEDKLQELYTKAITLNQLKSQSCQIDDHSLIQLMELNDTTDLDFLNKILTAIFLPELETF